MERLVKFLSLVPGARWRSAPPTWNVELQTALSDDLVKIGWGGILELTDAGREAVAKNAN